MQQRLGKSGVRQPQDLAAGAGAAKREALGQYPAAAGAAKREAVPKAPSAAPSGRTRAPCESEILHPLAAHRCLACDCPPVPCAFIDGFLRDHEDFFPKVTLNRRAAARPAKLNTCVFNSPIPLTTP
jgi:hypothetical protein